MNEDATVVRVEREEGLAVLTLDSPPLNLFDRAMFEGLHEAVEEIEGEPPRALLIRAEGRAVSGGVDVHAFDGLTPEGASASSTSSSTTPSSRTAHAPSPPSWPPAPPEPTR